MRLRLDRVNKRYGGQTILRDVSLELGSGSVLLLAGANGAGKSTLLRLVAGLIAPTSGSIHREDIPNGAIGYLAHATSVYPGLSAQDNLAFWQRLYHGDARQGTLLAALERTGLARHADERAGTFSRGMLQRLNLARLLLQAPTLMLLDEPGTGLDSAAVRLLHAEITAARDRGAAIVWVSHQAQSDSCLADRIVELAGRTVYYDGPAHGYAPC